MPVYAPCKRQNVILSDIEIARERDHGFNEYTKRRIVFYHAKGHRAPTIAKLLEAEGITVSRRGVRVEQTGDIGRRPGSGRPSKQTDDVKAIIVS